MTFGVALFATDYSIRPDEFARAAEERGFDSVFFPEHTHIPTSRKTPFPLGGELPKEYSHIHDLFVAMTAAAIATTRIKIGAGVCLVTEHDPIVLAKQAASLDALSNGRLILGIGAGWNAEEMENHGVPFKRRWRVVGERVKAMRQIWSQDVAEFHGDFVNFDPIWCWPKPARASRVQALREAADRAGRQFDNIDLAVAALAPNEDSCKRLRDLGFSHLILGIASEPRDKALAALDKRASLISKLR